MGSRSLLIFILALALILSQEGGYGFFCSGPEGSQWKEKGFFFCSGEERFDPGNTQRWSENTELPTNCSRRYKITTSMVSKDNIIQPQFLHLTLTSEETGFPGEMGSGTEQRQVGCPTGRMKLVAIWVVGDRSGQFVDINCHKERNARDTKIVQLGSWKNFWPAPPDEKLSIFLMAVSAREGSIHDYVTEVQATWRLALGKAPKWPSSAHIRFYTMILEDDQVLRRLEGALDNDYGRPKKTPSDCSNDEPHCATKCECGLPLQLNPCCWKPISRAVPLAKIHQRIMGRQMIGSTRHRAYYEVLLPADNLSKVIMDLVDKDGGMINCHVPINLTSGQYYRHSSTPTFFHKQIAVALPCMMLFFLPFILGMIPNFHVRLILLPLGVRLIWPMLVYGLSLGRINSDKYGTEFL